MSCTRVERGETQRGIFIRQVGALTGRAMARDTHRTPTLGRVAPRRQGGGDEDEARKGTTSGPAVFPGVCHAAPQPILMLDEATASVNLGSDANIQAAIRSKFQERTTLTIVHCFQKNTVMDTNVSLSWTPAVERWWKSPSLMLF